MKIKYGYFNKKDWYANKYRFIIGILSENMASLTIDEPRKLQSFKRIILSIGIAYILFEYKIREESINNLNK